jgi:hypothetical protein
VTDPTVKALAASQRAYVRAIEGRRALAAAARHGRLTLDGKIAPEGTPPEECAPPLSAYGIAQAMGVPESVVRAILKAAGTP